MRSNNHDTTADDVLLNSLAVCDKWFAEKYGYNENKSNMNLKVEE
jgi:hypothetical protein